MSIFALAFEGGWETRDADGRRIIEIKDGVLYESYYYENKWVTYDYDIYAYSGHLYAGLGVGLRSGRKHYDMYDINVNGSSIDWFNDTYKK